MLERPLMTKVRISRPRFFISQFALLGAIFFCLNVSDATAQKVPNGGARTSAAFDYIDLTGGSLEITDYVAYPYASDIVPGGFGIANRDGEYSQFTITNPAPEGAFSIAEFGVGIGINGLEQQPLATLHIMGGDDLDAYGEARFIVEDRNPTAALRELIKLQNNGAVGIGLCDVDTGTDIFLDNVDSDFSISSGSVFGHFRVASNSSSNSLNLASSGIGIGTALPASTLHVQADLDDSIESQFTSSTITTETRGGTPANRVMLSCINNGPSIVSLTDTNRPSFSQWMITNTVFGNIDSLSLRKNAAGAPNLTIFEDGNIRFTFNGLPNCTIKPNGNLFVRGVILSNSDRNLKENITPVDSAAILEKVATMPISTWNYNYDEDQIPHMGPMAQDFHAAFGLGVDNKTIASMDKDGVALAAIQGLNKKLESKSSTIELLHEKLESQAELLSNQSDRITNQSDLISEQAELILELTKRLERLEAVADPR